MNTIVLIRHGRSTHHETRPVTGQEFDRWVQAYDSAGVQEDGCLDETIAAVAKVPLILTSDLARSIESARHLNPEAFLQSDALFRETELPTVSFKGFKLRPAVWTILLRSAWLMGHATGCESYRKAKHRAEIGAQKLAAYAVKYESVALVGHGFFNQLLAAELRKNGWGGRRKTSAYHWGATVYTLE